MDSSQSEISRSLGVLFKEGDTIELRCVGHPRTISGYYRDFTKLARDAHALNTRFSPLENCYICLNPCPAELYGRRADQFAICSRGEAVKDQDILRRRWLLVDVDPVRPSGVSATDQQKEDAINLASQVYTWLVEQLGSKCIVCADSGNGAHMLIHLGDLINNDETGSVCQRFLQMLSDRFSNDQAKVDVMTHNAARICTLYGTVKRKGSDIPEQPHRMSKLVFVPDPLLPVDWQRMAALVDPYPAQQAASPPAAQSFAVGDALDIDAMLKQRSVEYTRDDHYRTNSGEMATRYQLSVCPFNLAHADRSAWIIHWGNGRIAAGCQHDGCAGKDWPTLRQLWGLPGEITASDIILPTSQSSLVQKPELLIVPSLHVAPEQIGWLWEDRFVVGGINLCAGRGGIGKTYFLCDLVARITNAQLLAPNGQPLRHGRVLYSTGEDHIAKVLEPRMQKHAVDRNLLEYIKGMPAGPYVQLLNVIQHCDLIRQALQARPDTVALVLDPISSFQGGSDSNKVADVRRFTAVLTQISEEYNIAVIGIHHFSKAKRDVAGDAISGSHAYRDAARSIWLFALDGNDTTRRLMVCDKHNWAEHCPPGLAYRIVNGRIQYEAVPLEMTSDQLLVQGTQQPLDVACAWLLARLSAGPQPAINMQIAATAENISDRTLKRAKKRLGVVSLKQGDHWTWSLPTATNQENKDAST